MANDFFFSLKSHINIDKGIDKKSVYKNKQAFRCSGCLKSFLSCINTWFKSSLFSITFKFLLHPLKVELTLKRFLQIRMRNIWL